MTKKYWTRDKFEEAYTLRQQGLQWRDVAERMGCKVLALKSAIENYSDIYKEIKEQNIANEAPAVEAKNTQAVDTPENIMREIEKQYKAVELPTYKPEKNTKALEDEYSILDLSDVHIGMINHALDEKTNRKAETYNDSIFIQELNILQKSIFKVHKLLSHAHRLRRLTIFCMGDILTNDRIFLEQPLEISHVVGSQIFKLGVPYFVTFFNNLTAIYDEIEIVCVVGNHGRSNPDHYNEPVENNFEYFLYKIWQMQFEKSKKIKIIVPDVRRYVHKIGPWLHMIEHGDLLRGATDTTRSKQIRELKLETNFHVHHSGHLHDCNEDEYTENLIAWRNGCWIYKDSYALERFRKISIPKQLFLGCSDKRIETWRYKLDLRGRKND